MILTSVLYRLAAVFLISLPLGNLVAHPLNWSDDFSLVGEVARVSGLPVVVVVTGPNCGFCERMRKDLFNSQQRCSLTSHAVAREFPNDTGGKITDFDGERVRSRMFLSRYEVFATPTVLFLDPSGDQLADPIVGYNEEDLYRSIVAERLSEARFALDEITDGERLAP